MVACNSQHLKINDVYHWVLWSHSSSSATWPYIFWPFLDSLLLYKQTKTLIDEKETVDWWTDGLKWVNKSSNLKHSAQSKPKAEALRVQELWKRRFAASRVSTPEVGSIGEITMESFVLLLHQPDFWRQKHNSVSSWSGQYFLKGLFFFN